MKKYLILIAAFCFLNTSFAQTAPDFTITATDGQSYSLYADFLNQGQTLVFEVMFTTCPPCNSFAPYLEPLYQDWGAGNYQVEFLSLSNKFFDSNADVADWLIGHNSTFLGAGEDGGALDAIMPYTSGQFGFFSGTPTFVVIAPDGTVSFNVGSGQNFQAKADAIEAAIIATGATKPPVSVNFDGMVETANGAPVALTQLGIAPINNNIYVTTIAGDFAFNELLQQDSTYQLTAEKDVFPTNGITTFDMVLIQKHILNIEPFDSPYKLIAADINDSGTVSTFDLVELRKIILFINLDFPNNKSWRFVDGDCDLSTMNCPLDDVITFTTNDDLTNRNIIAIKVGDVNNSADPNN